MRLQQETAWAALGLCFEVLHGPKTRAWIAARVEQERSKAAEYQLDCYIHADNCHEAPSFDQDPEDTEDLSFLCSKASLFAFIQRRPLSEAYMVEIFIRSELHVKGMQWQDAVKVLAHLSYLRSPNVPYADRFYLALKLLKWCRSALEKEADSLHMCDVEGSFAGLGNLASGDAKIGFYFSSERLFSIVAAILNPSPSLAASCTLAGNESFQNFEQPFEHYDCGYRRSELCDARKRLRASIGSNCARNERASAVLPRTILAALDGEPLGPSFKNWRSFTWSYAVHWAQRTLETGDIAEHRELLQCCTSFRKVQQTMQNKTKEWIRKYRVGVWYRLLTSAVRLISSLSIDDINHNWLLEQGALQALKKILQFLPADRMRSAQQEAALFIYRLFENQRVHVIVRQSPALMVTTGEIISALRAIDNDLFGEGWGTRIGTQLYEELVGGASLDKKSSGTDGRSARLGSASASSSSRRHPVKGARHQKASKKSVKCAREGCSLERQSGVKLKICAGCRQVRYCSKECQIADFPSHKLVCKSE
ncbi:hypothetical protein KFL_002010080 [Klebsormidium nitens]|uniref:MYND-type domain-containing protein n=1 Tax=Klebsormidium nitens TaxID=105231 RepID=A0A0U9I7L4_KLENI|nr:hypothetical protein KFL_002010080 [Klebsormidium nitens]|eukprot:GAQ84692.1 hypothetical protein KFL_002010080 [Klebsormidium nitens]